MKNMELLEQIESNNKVESVDKTTQVNVFDYFSKKALPQTAHKYFETLDVSTIDQNLKNQISKDQWISVDDLTKEHIFTSYIRSAVRKSKDYDEKPEEFIFAKIAKKISQKGVLLTYAEKRFFQYYISEKGWRDYGMDKVNIFKFCDAIIGIGTIKYYSAFKEEYKKRWSADFTSYINDILWLNNNSDKVDNNIMNEYNNLKEGKSMACFAYLQKNYPELSQEHISAILWNIRHESWYSASILWDKQWKIYTSGWLCQWHNKRFVQLKNFASNKWLSWKHYWVQLDFMMHEIRSKFPEFLQLNNKDIASKITTIVDKKRVLLFSKDELNEDLLYIYTKYFVYNFESPSNKKAKFERDRLPTAKQINSNWLIYSSNSSNLILNPPSTF